MARSPWYRAVIYEAHVRGMTMLAPDVPEADRGTFRGFAHTSVVEHLQRLGVTAVELMPVAAFATEPSVARRGLVNHWGYNPVAFDRVHASYAATDDPARELAALVERLHEAGIDVLLDVVLNHTADGAFPDDWYRERDSSGCGRSVDTSRDDVQEHVLAALRWWAGLGIDGFRYDLASVLARDADDDPRPPGALLTRAAADLPHLAHVVEPWDATPQGYALGRYGAPFAEWNDRFRDDVRDFWRGAGAGVRDLATRLAGSSDLVGSPAHTVNFVTAHDGFTLRDLVSYRERHNEANGEDGLDGHADNRSDNCGHEGESTDPEVNRTRQDRARALLATTLLARGPALIRMGDEAGHTQRGNNNAYCHDSPLTWHPWTADPGWDLRDWIAECTRVRRDWVGPDHLDHAEVDWLRPDGGVMTEADWADDGRRVLGMRLGEHTAWFDATRNLVTLPGRIY